MIDTDKIKMKCERCKETFKLDSLCWYFPKDEITECPSTVCLSCYEILEKQDSYRKCQLKEENVKEEAIEVVPTVDGCCGHGRIDTAEGASKYFENRFKFFKEHLWR